MPRIAAQGPLLTRSWRRVRWPGTASIHPSIQSIHSSCPLSIPSSRSLQLRTQSSQTGASRCRGRLRQPRVHVYVCVWVSKKEARGGSLVWLTLVNSRRCKRPNNGSLTALPLRCTASMSRSACSREDDALQLSTMDVIHPCVQLRRPLVTLSQTVAEGGARRLHTRGCRPRRPPRRARCWSKGGMLGGGAGAGEGVRGHSTNCLQVLRPVSSKRR